MKQKTLWFYATPTQFQRYDDVDHIEYNDDHGKTWTVLGGVKWSAGIHEAPIQRFKVMSASRSFHDWNFDSWVITGPPDVDAASQQL